MSKRRAIGVPTLPLDFSSAGVEVGGGERFSVRILQQEGAHFSFRSKNGSELTECFSVWIKEAATRKLIALVMTFGKGLAGGIVKSNRAL